MSADIGLYGLAVMGQNFAYVTVLCIVETLAASSNFVADELFLLGLTNDSYRQPQHGGAWI